MEAIMARYMVMRDGTIKDTEKNISIPNAPGNRHYREYQLWLEGKDSMENDLGTGPNTADQEAEPDLATSKANKISELKLAARGVLADSDWYIIRNTEEAVDIPSDVSNHRDSVRTYTSTAEGEINALTDVSSVEAYTFSFPTM
jgi:hypothetical protein